MPPESVIENFKKRSPENQQKVADYIARLPAEKPVQMINPWGLVSDRGLHITAEEIDEARREMWSKFPRELPGRASLTCPTASLLQQPSPTAWW